MSKRNVSRSDSRIRSGKKGTPDDRDGCRVFLGCFMALALLVWLINLMGTTTIVFFLLTLGAAYSLYFLYKTRTNAKRAREGEFHYRHGDFEAAYGCVEKISGQNADAALVAGLCLRNGTGCGQDHEKACSCFRFARSKSMEARAYYGEMLTMGTGCVRDVIKGIKELELAAAHDIPYANLCLGRLQFNGTLMKKNTGSGMRHLRIAAEAELPAAQYIVGYILFNGLEGIPRNRYQGLRYINLAASAGNLKAKKLLQKIG